MRTLPWVSSGFIRRIFAVGFLTAGSVLHAAATAATVGPTVELPKLVINEQRPLPPPESWRYAKLPGLEILSGASDRETQKLLYDFQLFNSAISVVWPGLKAHPAPPMSLIVCATGTQFAAFAPAEGGASTGHATLLLKDPEHVAIVLNFGVKAVALSPSEIGQADALAADGQTSDADGSLAGAQMRVDYHRQLSRQYIRYLLSFSQPRLPAWLEEGLSQLLMGMRVDRKFIQFARLDQPPPVPGTAGAAFAGSADPSLPLPIPGETLDEKDFNVAMVRAGFMPLDQLFAVPHGAPETDSPIAGKWAMQSAALVHMWLYGEGKQYNQGFAKFVVRAQQGPVTEAIFKECFGVGYQKMLTQLRVYLNDTAYQYQEFSAGKGGGLPEPAKLELRDATQPEIGRLKGEALVLAGRVEPAYEEMRDAYVRGPVDPALIASLGLRELQRGETKRARDFLEAAARLQSGNPRAGLELARLRYADAQAKAAATDRLDEAQTRSVIQPLAAARQQPPPLPEVYELMTDVWLHSAAAPAKTDLAMINQGVILFQRRPVLLYQAAELNRRHGNPAEARLMAQAGLQLSRTSEARAAFQEILDGLPAK